MPKTEEVATIFAALSGWFMDALQSAVNVCHLGADRVKSERAARLFGRGRNLRQIGTYERIGRSGSNHISKFNRPRRGAAYLLRSEERRVGKECRSRRSPY